MAWTLVQQQANQATNAVATLPGATTAGNLVIIVATQGSGTALTPPSGFSTVASIANGTVSETFIMASFNTVGGQTTWTVTGGSGGAMQVTSAEFTCTGVASVAAASATGTNTAGAVTSITVTNGAGELSGDLVIVAALQHVTATNTITWTDPAGFTEISTLSTATATNHGYGARELSGTGASQAATVTSTLTGSSTGWTAAIASFTQPAAAAAARQALIPQQPRRTSLRARVGCSAVAAGILAAAPVTQAPAPRVPSRPPPVVQHVAPHRAIPVGRGIAAKTTFSPQPSSVPPPAWRPQPRYVPPHRATWRAVNGRAPAVVTVTAVPPARPAPVTNRPPPPHRALVRGILVPAPQPQVTAKLPPTAVSRRPQHRAIPVADGIAAPANLSPQPSRVPPPAWRQPNAPRPAHRGTWRAISGPAPGVVAVTAVPPARPAPTVNRPPPPHRAITRAVLAKTTLSAQPTRVNGPLWRQPNAPRPAHRLIWRQIAGPAPPPPPFQVARSTPTVTDPRDGTATVTRNVTSSPTVTDPRDGTATVTRNVTSSPTVTDPRDGTAGVT